LFSKKLYPVGIKDYVAASVLALVAFNGVENSVGAIFSNAMETAPGLGNKGSNAMAVHASHTTLHQNYLWINAHQPNTGPQAFYEAHLCSEEGLNILGGLLAGGPCIFHGVNENLGWAHTVNYVDRMDVYQLEMNPDNKDQYKFDGQWLTLEKKKVHLKIKGVPVKIGKFAYWSKYGPTMKNKQGFFSIRLGAAMRIGALDEWYQMDKAKNFTEFYRAISKQELSMFNIVYADRHDTIFYISNGLVPVRDDKNGFNWKGTLPGNTSKTLWTDFLTIKEHPQYINPEAGFLFNTNHSPFLATGKNSNLSPTGFSKTSGWETWHNNRSARILELMPPQEPLAFEAFKKIKFDKQLPAPLQYPYRIDSMFSLPATEFPSFEPLINDLKYWDKKGGTDSKGAAIFLLTYEYIKKRLAGQPYREITKQEAIDTYQHVYDHMIKYFGKTGITLGQLQKLVRGERDWPLGGFPDLLSPQWKKPYKSGMLKSIGGDGYIMFIHFPQNELPVIETLNMYGASSHPSSKHFDDQVDMYLHQQTKKMTLDKTAVYKAAERIYHPL
jgi:acyl-homoserine-lactone acylase